MRFWGKLAKNLRGLHYSQICKCSKTFQSKDKKNHLPTKLSSQASSVEEMQQTHDKNGFLSNTSDEIESNWDKNTDFGLLDFFCPYFMSIQIALEKQIERNLSQMLRNLPQNLSLNIITFREHKFEGYSSRVAHPTLGDVQLILNLPYNL